MDANGDISSGTIAPWPVCSQSSWKDHYLFSFVTLFYKPRINTNEKIFLCPIRSVRYNHNTFWYWPWTRGENGHPHTGVDIFGKVGTPVVSQTGGIVLYADDMP